MKRLPVFFVLLCTLLGLHTTQAQNALDIVQWSAKAEALGGDEYLLTFSSKVEDGWVVYSQFIDEGGPIPTSVNFDTPLKVTDKGKESGTKIAKFDKVFEMDLIKFEDKYILTKKVKVDAGTKAVSGYLEFMCCEDARCLPPTAWDFSITLPAAPTQAKTENQSQPVEANAPPESSAPTSAIEEGSALQAGETPVTWTFNKKAVEGSENEYVLELTASIQDGWVVYSQFIEDGGPIPTSVTLVEGAHFSVHGDIQEITPDPSYRLEKFDKIFEMDLVKFKKTFTIQVPVTWTNPTQAITGYLTFQTCDDERCLPPTDVDFSFQTTANATASSNNETLADFNETGDLNVAALQESLATPVGQCEGASTTSTEGQSYWSIFILGFLGGFVALLTPCVFPMIPMTVSFFTKMSGSRKKGLQNAFTYGISIIVIYVALGLAVTAIFGADIMNWLSTHWIPNTIFFLLFMIFAFSFFGYFEITLPSSWTTKTDRQADRGGLIGIFFMAFTLSLVSFSCTGPIIGNLLVGAASNGDLAGPAIGMFGFSLALAIPFVLFAIFPNWLNSLPKSGGWMNSMKVLLGFAEVALAFKFLSVADLTEHWGILKYEIFLGVWVLVALFMALYLFNLIRFPHDGPRKRPGIPRAAFALFMLFFAGYLGWGFTYNEKTHTFHSPDVLSGLAPPPGYSFTYPVDCPAGLNQCFHDFNTGVAYAREVNKPILLDFTGHGCVNCRKMEQNVWVLENVQQRIREDYVLVSLYVDDREPLEKVLQTPEGKKLRNIGNKWAEFQRVNFKTQSQPFYVLIAPDDLKVLNEPRGYTPDAEEYEQFLECGTNTYKANYQ